MGKRIAAAGLVAVLLLLCGGLEALGRELPLDAVFVLLGAGGALWVYWIASEDTD